MICAKVIIKKIRYMDQKTRRFPGRRVFPYLKISKPLHHIDKNDNSPFRTKNFLKNCEKKRK